MVCLLDRNTVTNVHIPQSSNTRNVNGGASAGECGNIARRHKQKQSEDTVPRRRAPFEAHTQTYWHAHIPGSWYVGACNMKVATVSSLWLFAPSLDVPASASVSKSGAWRPWLTFLPGYMISKSVWFMVSFPRFWSSSSSTSTFCKHNNKNLWREWTTLLYYGMNQSPFLWIGGCKYPDSFCF